MDRYIASNRELWDHWTDIHERSEFYDLEGFKAGRSSLNPIEREELGDVSGKSLLHLQCHFGLDTLSWARLGASVTGGDLSDRAIELARSLSQELGIDARFVRSELYSLPDLLDGQFDIVYTSYGVLYWLPDIRRWGEVAAHFLKPGGTFYIVEYHPFANVFENEGTDDLRVAYPYFQGPKPLTFETHGSYADPNADYHFVEYGWNHPLGAVVTSLSDAGLRIQHLHEFPYTFEQRFPFMEQDADGKWWIKGRETALPLLFSLKATR
ncbi:MAG: class I SAM-dependent methyltransferase [Chloroflexota bacterium]|nr:class I SAM-dependent methyltransferase [Chloroflexota bacterium]